MAERAARLAKADLSSEMVYEFPELQGLMGRYYIEASGEDAAVAAATEEHYAPLGPSDDVPTAPVSVAVSLAEKIDKLTGFWAIDEKPTGSKDPFALRRAALGVIRTILENDLPVHLIPVSTKQLIRGTAQTKELLDADYVSGLLDALDKEADFSSAFSLFVEETSDTLHSTDFLDMRSDIPKAAKNLLAFIHDRLKVYLKDQGIRHDIIDACIAMDGNDDINLLVKRARALSETLKTEDGKNLIQGFKRANNILSQAEAADGVEYSYGADVKFAETDEERALFAALDTNEPTITKAMADQDFTTAMSAMASLRAPIDAFFDATQINADNDTVRRNRLNLLSRIRTICSSVADLTKIDG
jgi:glycyl-tRNA synthetase beta chain